MFQFFLVDFLDFPDAVVRQPLEKTGREMQALALGFSLEDVVVELLEVFKRVVQHRMEGVFSCCFWKII